MKIPDRLPIKMLAVLLILPFASPYMYTGFQTYGLLYSIDFWISPILLFLFGSLCATVVHFLLPEIIPLFSRRMRSGAVRRLLITWIGLALFIELLMVVVHWNDYLDGEAPGSLDSCMLCKMWDAKNPHTH